MDPYAQLLNREPGRTCTQHYECKSKQCSMREGVCIVRPNYSEMLSTCQSHSDCNVGMFCAESYLASDSQFQLAKFGVAAIEEKLCMVQRQLNEKCSTDYDCANSLACANSQCRPYGSI